MVQPNWHITRDQYMSKGHNLQSYRNLALGVVRLLSGAVDCVNCQAVGGWELPPEVDMTFHQVRVVVRANSGQFSGS